MTTQRNAMGVVGLGRVGLSTAVCFAARGIKTIGVDIDEERVRNIGNRHPPFFESGLPRLMSKVVGNKKLKVTTDFSSLAETDYQFIAVPTPSSKDGSIDLAFVRAAADSVGRIMRDGEGFNVVVLKSTVTPGTALNVVLPALQAGSGRKLGEFGLASNPEFLREGHAIEDTMHPDRLVIGTSDLASKSAIASFYRKFYRTMPETVWTTPINAELIKYASNAFLATKVTFINEIANLCTNLPGADISVVARGIGLDRRISPHFLRAGLGYGGSCFPKDVEALLRVAEQAGVELGVAASAQGGNKRQALVAVELAETLIGDLGGKRIALLGLAFKPDSDDMREAVSLRLISELQRRSAKVVAYDPAATPNARRILREGIDYAKSVRDCLRGADCCIIVTEWAEFLKLRPRHFKESMRVPALVDGRRVMDPALFRDSGVKFASIGLSGTA